MKAVIRKASKWDCTEIKEFNTLEDLLKFQEETGCVLIIGYSKESIEGKTPYKIMIYDDHFE